MSQLRFKKAKPMRGKTRMERLVARIPNEEKLLEVLDKELPEERIRIFYAMRPYLRFKLSPTFDANKLPLAPYLGDRARIPQPAEPSPAETRPVDPALMTVPDAVVDLVDAKPGLFDR